MAAVAEASPGVDIAPLEPIEPISMAPIETESIAPGQIEIAPLTPITAVDVAPMAPQIQRD
jgi:hypothetical protein